jgi:serine/threonine protein kinase
VSGLKVIHENNITHRNLKTENILVNYDKGNLTLKIGDFELARTNENISNTICGLVILFFHFFLQL